MCLALWQGCCHEEGAQGSDQTVEEAVRVREIQIREKPLAELVPDDQNLIQANPGTQEGRIKKSCLWLEQGGMTN